MFLEIRRISHIVVVDNAKDPKKSKPWLIVTIVLSSISIFFGLLAIVLRIMARRQRAKEAANVDGEVPSEEDAANSDPSGLNPPTKKEHPYYNSNGYEATPDQNQTLLGNDERAPVTRWDNDFEAVQRPESIASSYNNAPPPRYE
ncbi:uncharacterized protein Z520_02366 [Fonsecaea multimorphosa CBS 102226]|uniref:Uncharacterized protein n=1 Tax=Fonsecaea multimorphosa CBS 102226 TaxID=1442371 RepID=A0A0D2K819_9EURO|nr:uncharacterized protein Z520_02366 [Fonsecaea multimorphosa CBS 102226]KIY02228.1 hypothetical protein Z520_02366 [Fonsecaea multimorphosa CBS 102226]OAL29419.1 hypothetical protein AYO22_02313 [Fonsecaea multimorphosa]